VPLLWRLHRVHHSATTLTPFTVFRVHPVESAIYFFRAFFVFSLVSGIFVWLFGRHLSIIDVLGVNALGFAANAAFANLRHSHIWVGFGRLEHFLVSPAQHQLHHSSQPGRGNYGSVLSVWDRCLGTFKLSGKRRSLTFGL
jgi:sterol desaturase/sphingolipid hydroxylase (fatty acid hydroxylase superfamily)